MRVAAFSSLLAGALLAAGCGGTQGAGAGASDLVPASVPVFIQVDTDPGSSQWKTVSALADRFPDKNKAVSSIKKEMLQSGGFSWEKDLKPALGKELDVVLLDFRNGETDAVGLMQPRDEGRFADVIKKGNAQDTSTQVVYEKFNGWEVFSDSRAKIARFEQESAAAHRMHSDDAGFQRATGELGDTVARAYVNGPAVMDQLRAAIGRNGNFGRKVGTLGWLAAGLGATSSGLQLNVIVHGTPGKFFKG